MPDGDRRIRLVCEDRLTERFLSKVCQRQKLGVLHVDIAPSGKGAASAWVRRKYPEFVKLHRSKNYQKNLCLLVAIDGDNKGVPTWSIETWLASLVNGSVYGEDRPLKEDNVARHLWQDDASKAQTLTVAADNWRTGPPLLPSLVDAYTEGFRIGV